MSRDAHEILVVDDGSSDATRELAQARAAADPRVRVLVHDVNRGYGAAVRTGIAAARLEWVFLTDADLQFDLAELARFVPLAQSSDIVAGYRIAPRRPAAPAARTPPRGTRSCAASSTCRCATSTARSS